MEKSKLSALFSSILGAIIFSIMFRYINNRLFDETSVKLFVYSLHAMELILCMIRNERQESLQKKSFLACQYLCSFTFFYFLLWCLGSPHFLDRQYLSVNCAITNYLLLLTSKSSQRTSRRHAKRGPVYLSSANQRRVQTELEHVDVDVDADADADVDRNYGGDRSQSADEINGNNSLKSAPCFHSNAVHKDDDTMGEKTLPSRRNCPTIIVEDEGELPAHEAAINAHDKIRTEHASKSANRLSNLIFTSVPKLSLSLFFLCASSSLYLLDWEEKWQNWPIVTLFGAYIGSLLDEIMYIIIT